MGEEPELSYVNARSLARGSVLDRPQAKEISIGERMAQEGGRRIRCSIRALKLADVGFHAEVRDGPLEGPRRD
jgi:hypothetical protein